jgi:hypothetical protein
MKVRPGDERCGTLSTSYSPLLLWLWEPHPCIASSVPAATVGSWLMVYVAAYQCRMLHPMAKYSIPLLDHSKPFGMKNLASNNKLFWNQDKCGYSSPSSSTAIDQFLLIIADSSRRFSLEALNSSRSCPVGSNLIPFKSQAGAFDEFPMSSSKQSSSIDKGNGVRYSILFFEPIPCAVS